MWMKKLLLLGSEELSDLSKVAELESNGTKIWT